MAAGEWMNSFGVSMKRFTRALIGLGLIWSFDSMSAFAEVVVVGMSKDAATNLISIALQGTF